MGIPACLVSTEPSFIPSSCECKAFMMCLGRKHLPFPCCWDGLNLSCSYMSWSVIPDFLPRILDDMNQIYALFCHSWFCPMLRQVSLWYSLNLISLEHPVYSKYTIPHSQACCRYSVFSVLKPYHCGRWVLQLSEVQFLPPPLHNLLKISIDSVLMTAVASKEG